LALAAAIVFYSLVALFPAITAGVSVYALFANVSGAGFTYIQRTPIASAWRARRAEDIVELINYGMVRCSLIIDLQKEKVRERIMEELAKAFRPYERGTELEVGCSSIIATGVKPH
jgi:hypothetical protein